jgi:AcrR family transcriptional regulator
MPKIIADMQIYQAVIETVSERGYAGATTRQIADAAGVSEVTLFRKFGTKSELVNQTISALIEHTDFQSATRYSGDISRDLMRVLQAYRDTVVGHGRFFFALFLENQRSPELDTTLAQPLLLFRSIGELLKRYQQEGILRPEHPLHTAAALLGPLIYLAVLGSTIPEAPFPPMDLQSHLTHFLSGRATSEKASL